MAFWKKDEPERTPSEQALDKTVESLPSNPATWTDEQRATHSEKSSKVMNENATKPGRR